MYARGAMIMALALILTAHPNPLGAQAVQCVTNGHLTPCPAPSAAPNPVAKESAPAGSPAMSNVRCITAGKLTPCLPRVSGTPTEIVRVTANGLFDDYDSNEIATDNRLKGKIVDVIGRVQSIDKSVSGHMYVGLATSNQFKPAQMYVDSSEEAKIAALRKGQLATFRCPKMERRVGTPWGNDCVLMKAQ
jgi:hypothetical protein